MPCPTFLPRRWSEKVAFALALAFGHLGERSKVTLRTAPEQHGKTSRTRNACSQPPWKKVGFRSTFFGAVVVGVVGVGCSVLHGGHTMPRGSVGNALT